MKVEVHGLAPGAKVSESEHEEVKVKSAAPKEKASELDERVLK